MLSGKRVLITGGTGFIGGRLAEKLVLEHGATVRILVRDWGKAIRVARMPVEFAHGDVHDLDAIERAVEDCDYVVHCAHDFSDQWAMVPSSVALAEAAQRHGAQRMVYISSMSVYEPLPASGIVDEESDTPGVNDYARVKLAIEREMERLWRDQGFETVNIRPTIVYGPYCPPWTFQPVAALRSRTVVLPEHGEGVCWAVYVDDVADALVASLVRPEAAGETFLIGGPEGATWGEFYRSYERALGINALAYWDTDDVYRAMRPAAVARPRTFLSTPAARGLYRAARKVGGHKFWHEMRQKVKPLQFPATETQVALFASRAQASSQKARDLLGYEPQFDLERGMEVTSEFIRWAQLDRAWA